MDSDHAAAIFTAFIVPNRRERYTNLLKNAKSRSKLRTYLAHFRDLDPRYATRIVPSNLENRAIAEQLRKRGAPASCYVLAEVAELDGQTLSLDEALDAVVGQGGGAFLSCVPGKLAYYEGEEPGERYILERAAV
jgi:hypothetical protein